MSTDRHCRYVSLFFKKKSLRDIALAFGPRRLATSEPAGHALCRRSSLTSVHWQCLQGVGGITRHWML